MTPAGGEADTARLRLSTLLFQKYTFDIAGM
jgi:hypothetical protein